MERLKLCIKQYGVYKIRFDIIFNSHIIIVCINIANSQEEIVNTVFTGKYCTCLLVVTIDKKICKQLLKRNIIVYFHNLYIITQVDFQRFSCEGENSLLRFVILKAEITLADKDKVTEIQENIKWFQHFKKLRRD